jgi:hypothetical protein
LRIFAVVTRFLGRNAVRACEMKGGSTSKHTN